MVERQARDLEVQVRIPVQIQIFLLKFMKKNVYYEGNLQSFVVSLKINRHIYITEVFTAITKCEG